jgi:hypothetical protein
MTISGHHVAHHTVTGPIWIVGALWVVAGIVTVIGLGAGLTRLAAALAIVSTEWWILTKAEHRLEKRRGGYKHHLAKRRWGDEAAERNT